MQELPLGTDENKLYDQLEPINKVEMMINKYFPEIAMMHKFW